MSIRTITAQEARTQSAIGKARVATVAFALVHSATSCAPPAVDFVRIGSPRVALTHVELVDGTGQPTRTDQSIVLEGAQIVAVGESESTAIPTDAQVLDLRGYTVIPGIVGMHNHLFYATDGGTRYIPVARQFAHLYLAAGVTSLRTAGAADLKSDTEIKRHIDEGREVGPKIHLTSPYIRHERNLGALVAATNAMADLGVKSLKAYTDVGRDALATVIGTAHRRGLKVTGHLCAVGFRQAAGLGIDNLEHGLLVDTEFYSRKVPDQCPEWGATLTELAMMTVASPPIQETIRALVAHRVAITSTLALFDAFARPASLDARTEALLTRSALQGYRGAQQRQLANPTDTGMWQKLLHMEMEFERNFVSAGGLLMAGADPTGWGGVLAGLGDQRNIELLAEAGFTPEQAIKIASANGAEFLGESAAIGVVTPGKRADVVVIRGSLVADIRNIRNVEIVFKDGVGYDSAKLIQTEYGKIGETSWRGWLALGIGLFVLVVLLLRAQFVARRRKRQGGWA